jgi:ribosomal protein S1|tara:strand:+ start:986 stop:1411 length:426 start_codon:yes stop_codon:yes gene_type:complete
VETLVESANLDANTIILRAHRKPVAETVLNRANIPFNALVPGVLINCVVEKFAENGLVVKFLGVFSAVIDELSLGAPCTQEVWKQRYNVGSVILARIVFQDPASKALRLSMRPHVLDMAAPKNLPALGTILENFTVSPKLN